jgi:hypothetical protein
MSNKKNNIRGYDEITSFKIGGKTIFLGENLEEKDKPYTVCEYSSNYAFGMTIIDKFCDTNDYLSAVDDFNKRISRQLEQVRSERDGRGIGTIMLGENECFADSKNEDFVHQFLVINPTALSRDYRNADTQVVFATHGNGCRPDALGQSVFVCDIFSDEKYCFKRHEILGIADISKLPEVIKRQIDKFENALNEREKESVIIQITENKDFISQKDKSEKAISKPKIAKQAEL